MALIITVDMGVIPGTGGIRRGIFLSRKGPSKYDFLISGVHDCTWRDGLRFEFDGFGTNIVITRLRRATAQAAPRRNRAAARMSTWL